MSPRPRAVAILNPATGRRRAEEIEALLRATLERRFDLDVLRTGSPGDARLLAREAAKEARLIVAVGGDGTVSDVAFGVVDSDAVLAIIPTGSTNIVARSLGIPLHPVTAARLLLRPPALRYMDVAVSGDRLMLHMAGAGLDALTMRDARRDWKRLAAWLAYVPSAFRHLLEPPTAFSLMIDGTSVTVAARMVLIANGGFVINPWFRVGRSIRPDDGVMDVCIFAPPGPVGLATMALWLLAGSVDRSRHFLQYPAHEVWLSATPAAPIEIDGDYAGHGVLHLQLRPGVLPVVVPGTARSESNDEWLPGERSPSGGHGSVTGRHGSASSESRRVIGE